MLMMAATDADAIATSLSDPDAFGAIFDRHHDVVFGYLRRRVGPALAEELAAETFVRAFDLRARFDPAHVDAGPWVFGIAANLLRRHHRSEGRRLRAYARSAAADAVEELDGVAERMDARRAGPALAMALAALKPADREPLLLLAWADLTYEEIAVALAVPIGTVRSRIHRARATVRQALEDNHG